MGVVALVFLVVGYQTALFVHHAAVEKIVSNRDSPDTVFVRMNGAGNHYGGDSGKGSGEDVPKGRGPETGNGSDIRKSSGTVTGQGTWKSSGNEVGSGAGKSDVMVVAVKEADHSPQARAIASRHRPVRSFRFDPNTATIEDLQLLGFSLKQAQSIDNYRKKGGRFRRKSDFARSYVVSEQIYKRLEPYIDIPLVDLNTADSAAFDNLPGIGGYFASKMVSYRRSLGGYSFKEQLMDIYNFDKEKFEALQDLIVVTKENIRPYKLWSLPEDSLKVHPYIGRNAAHGIIVFRENNPPSEWTIESLVKAGVIRQDKAALLLKCHIASP